MRLYVSGPVTGRPDGNRAAFEEARAALEVAGPDVFVPHDLVLESDTHETAMLICLNELTGRDFFRGQVQPRFNGVALLDWWHVSKGACVERDVAEACGIECRPLRDWL